ncbi:MAG TPA: prepilin-type N-terminal cleavage/methylation domain-containing protein [Syntrophorhabdaceae bacterium]|nr:prepilin-type N-terminal cleavage/methylation domain-containing protein [Syntrophorhabdaceae bacterium]HQM81776.1 prepilin-type N-terminal cleavage/methylation domain-containing protein [Syntrophorhabdaceae bacterium]
MIRVGDHKGFTLIELIIFIIIGAIFVPASMLAFTSVMNSYSRPDYYVKARFYADKRMAEITNRPYDSIPPGVSTLCPDSYAAEASPDSDYSTKCTIISINRDLSELLTPDLTLPYKDPYKQITVAARHSGLLSDYVISTIVTRRPILP